MASVLSVLIGVFAQDDGLALVQKAIDATLKKGSVRIEGQVGIEEDQASSVRILVDGPGEDPYEGAFKASIAGGVTKIVLDADNVSAEIYRRGDKVVKRLAWSRGRKGIEELAREATTLLDLERIKANLGKTKFSKPEEKLIDGRKVRLITGPLPKKLLRVDEEPEPMKFSVSLGRFELDAINATFAVDEDGLIFRITIDLEKSSNLGNAIQRVGAEDEEGTDKKKKKSQLLRTTTYTFTLKEFSADAKVEIPRELQKFFTE